ncbi:interferon gamma receptor 1-like isoform X2 [Gadus macrocephalus]|uniref:interferon gamma receptor 1-like isoform X2 n=1 Tax=Gadus macrocephalus TaxID=80720 RepID=UPI0028CBA167|nr:interferon gamma receptor 1-like isoform X2 [Gadus macrocephalus]
MCYVKMALSMECKTCIFLFSLLLRPGSAFVPSATNISLDCHNFINILRWDYSDHATLKPNFEVTVEMLESAPKLIRVDYPSLQCDLSAFSNPDSDYRVTVTAVVGLNESLPAPPDGLTFSYFRSSPSEQLCSLDLPPVNVTFQPGVGITISFSHPAVLYGQRRLNKPKSKFNYEVAVTGDQNYSGKCKMDVCEKTIPAGLQQDCVRINGDWNKITVLSTQDYCARAGPAPAPAYQGLFIGLGVCFVVALLILAFAFICKRVRASSQTPFALSFPEMQDHSHSPLIQDQNLSPVSPGAFYKGDRLTITAVDQNGIGSVQSVITAAEMEPERPRPAGKPAVANGSVPLAPRLKPAAEASGMDPARNDPGVAARAAGQGDPRMQPQVGDDPGGAAGAPGPLPLYADVDEGDLGGEPPDESLNDSGYEQRVRVELTPGDTVDAYLG